MNFRRGMTALACGLVAAIGVAGAPQEASADKFVWVAKFACPAELDPVISGAHEQDGGGFIGPFYFETVVNVYNADDDEVVFDKKIVLALRQSQLSSFTNGLGGGSLISDSFRHILAPMDALAIDCNGVFNHLADSPDPRGGFIEPGDHAINGRLDGVIVVEALEPSLVVEALYGTATTTNGTGFSSGIHVNRVNAVVADGTLPPGPGIGDDDDDSVSDDDDSVSDDDDSVSDDDDSVSDDDDSVSDDDDSIGDDDDSL